jgi:hypothetical protein
MITVVLDARSQEEADSVSEWRRLPEFFASMRDCSDRPIHVVTTSLSNIPPESIILFWTYRNAAEEISKWENKFSQVQAGHCLVLVEHLQQYCNEIAERFRLMGCLSLQGMDHWRFAGRSRNIANGLWGRRDVLQKSGIQYDDMPFHYLVNYDLVETAYNMTLPQLLSRYIDTYIQMVPGPWT